MIPLDEVENPFNLAKHDSENHYELRRKKDLYINDITDPQHHSTPSSCFAELFSFFFSSGPQVKTHHGPYQQEWVLNQFMVSQHTTSESCRDTSVSADILCLAVCVCDIMNKAGMCGRSAHHEPAFSVLQWKRVNQHGCTLRRSISKQNKI